MESGSTTQYLVATLVSLVFLVVQIAMALRCYKVRSLPFLARKLCDILEKYFILRELQGENCARLQPGWVAGAARAVTFASLRIHCAPICRCA